MFKNWMLNIKIRNSSQIITHLIDHESSVLRWMFFYLLEI